MSVTSYKLTEKQQRVLTVIKQHIEQYGSPPTRVELADILGFRSPNAAEEHIKALARKGAIEIVEGASRGIRLPDEVRGLPIVGRVAAGHPILAAEHIEDYAPIPASFFNPPADYLLEVTGFSMQDAGILPGDYVAVHQLATAKNNDIVIARIEDEVTIKRFRRNGTEVMLLPENVDFSPIKIDLRKDPFCIEGICVGVIRRS
jgi:repressor LexA